MPKMVCIKCELQLKPETNGVVVSELFMDDTQVYKVWEADLWKCPGCGMEVIAGFADNPIAEHFEQEKMVTAWARIEVAKQRGEHYFLKEKY